eukprot:3136230-Amphidinium_carterae.1
MVHACSEVGEAKGQESYLDSPSLRFHVWQRALNRCKMRHTAACSWGGCEIDGHCIMAANFVPELHFHVAGHLAHQFCAIFKITRQSDPDRPRIPSCMKTPPCLKPKAWLNK